MSLLQMSISAGVMILVITVIRALAINRLPKKTFLALWGIVLARLLLPFSWPSPFSVYSLVNFVGNPAKTVLPIVPAANGFTTTPTFAPNARLSLWIWIWGIGVAICILYFTVTYIRCRREFLTSQPVENAFTMAWLTEHKCKRPITIRQTSSISAPLTYGIFRPVILMPALTDWRDKRKLQYILTHEYVHIRRFDGATKLILTFGLCVHWFNPLVWAMYALANRDMELSCDEKVVQTFGETMKSTYALALISMEEKKSGLTPLCNNFSKNAIEERIEAIMKMKKTTIGALVVALCLVGSVTTVFATSAATNADSSIYTEMGTVMTKKNSDDSPCQYSIDDGASWISEADYNAMYPQDKIVWWTYDEYKSWLEEYSSRLQGYIGSDVKYKDKNGNWVEWTQEHVNAAIQRENEILESIKNGAKVSKTVNGNDSIVAVVNAPSSENMGVSYGVAGTNQNGEIFDLGSFFSKEERLDAVRQYYKEQVRVGKMSQNEADTLIQDYK